MNCIPLLLRSSKPDTSNPNPQEQEPQRGRMQEIDLGIHTIRSHGGGLASKHKHDWIILVILVGIEIGLQLISPFYRYVGKDMMTDLKYPFNDNTVPIWSVPIYAVLLPIIVFLCFYMKRTCVYDLHHSVLGLLFTVLITGIITDSIKLATGRPRPNFYWRCFPDGKEVYDALGGVVCHGEPGEVKEGHKSFPSGHTSWSFAGLGFLSLYLSSKVKAFNREGHVAKLCIVFAPLLAACLVGISRVDDYWHHWQDVFAGALIGLFVAAFCYRQFYPNPYHEEGWGPYAYFRAAQERGSQQNGDALRTMSLQVEPTSLENMESGTSTAPR
nr:PREDICTED: lipid phosphate phosphatase 1-like isoform X2 [Raphanus sativus]